MNYLLGFGISGLGFITKINNKKNFKIIEKNSYPGGHSKSHKFNNFYFDEGAHIMHSKNIKFLKKFTKINHTIQKSKVLNYRSNNWFYYPVQENLLGIDNKLDYLKSYLLRENKKRTNTFEDWCQINYGSKITSDFYKVYTKKYWRRNLDELDTDWLKGRLISPNDTDIILNTFFINNHSKASFNKFRYPKNKGFINFFEREFKKYQKHCYFNSKIEQIDLKRKQLQVNKKLYDYENIYSTIPLPELLKIIDFPNYIKKDIEGLNNTSLTCINLIIKNTHKVNHHWHYIYDKKIPISRVSIINNLINVKSNKLAIQLEIFNDKKKDDIKYNYKRIIKKFLETINLDIDSLIDYEIKKIKYAYIISDNKKEKRVKRIKKYLSNYNFYPFGLYGDWKYYWTDQSYYKGQEMAHHANK